MKGKVITLVFDDGPCEPLCEIVDKLKEYGFRGGFAVIGKKINDETEGMLRYAIENGFQLVSHSQTHAHLEECPNKEEIASELTGPIREVQKRLGVTITMARLPFISYNHAVLETADEWLLPLLGSGMDGGRDWANDTTPEIIANAVLNSVRDGAVGCLHVMEKTLAALDMMLPRLQNEGYQIVTPQELFERKGIQKIPRGVNIDNVNDFIGAVS